LGEAADIDSAPGTDVDHLTGLKSMNGRRALIGHADTQLGSLIDGHVGDILTFESHLPINHLVLRIAHDGHEKRRFTRPVGSEQDVGFSRLDFQVNVLQYDFVAEFYLQVFYK
jgi:hypothetical protein